MKTEKDTASIRAIICDIEGTIGSIHFVRDVLFPYAAQHLPAFVRKHSRDENVRAQLRAVAERSGLPEDDLETLISQLLDWIESDTKATPLKALQGMVWLKGYESGDYQAHVYKDAFHNLTAWHAQGIPQYVYSSGSVQAQKLFFQYSCFGDMRSLFSGYFDTTTGPKQASRSYELITERIGFTAGKILFLSDIEAELDAAAEAGLHTAWIIRPEDSSLVIENLESRHSPVETFDRIGL